MTDIRAISLCSLAMVVTPQYVGDASGSVLFPDRLLHKLHGRGLAKSTICWISLSLFLSLPPIFFPSLLTRLSVFFSPLLQIRIKKHIHSQTVCTTRAFCWLEYRARLRQVVRSFFLLPEIFRDTAVFSQRTCFFAISRMI